MDIDNTENTNSVNPLRTGFCTRMSTDAFPTDRLLPRSVYHGLIRTYLDLVYPTIPVMHRPTFIRNIENNRAIHDDTFLSLTVSICAAAVALLPRKFEEFQNTAEPLPFKLRTQMVDACQKFVVDLRPPEYFADLSQPKWAIVYMFQVAYFQLGTSNRVAFWYAEAAQMNRLLKLEEPNSNLVQDCIDIQLRKKAFWLTFFIFV